MRAIRSTAAAVVMTFGTMRLVTAQELTPVQTGAAARQPGVVPANGNGTISGNAVTAVKGQTSRSRVQLRDTQTGRIIANSTTDKSGAFTFDNVKPGTYLVEVLGENESVIAASSVLTLQAGDALTVAITVPLAAAGGGIVGNAAMATVVAAGAAAAGVLAVKRVGDPTCPE
jgi:hypothetical protein